MKKELNKIEKSIEKELGSIEKRIDREFKEVETWMIERKKFLIKLGWVVGLIIVLLIFSHFYFRTKGFG